MKIEEIAKSQITRNQVRSIWKYVSAKLFGYARFLILGGIGFTLVYPILFMLTSAFRSRDDMWNPSVIWITRHYTFEHIRKLIEVLNYPVVLGNTVVISLGSALIQTMICAMVGYGFARYKFKGRGIIFGIVIFTIIVPPQTTIIPLYMLLRFFGVPGLSNLTGTINLINTPFAFWLPTLFGMGLRSGLFIFIFRQFFRGLPKDLENAALIDGCGAFKTYISVMLPNAIPAMVTVFMFSLVWHWNDFFMSSMLLSTNKTISVALAELRTVIFRLPDGGAADPMINQVRIQAGALLSVIPMLALFSFGQKFFTESIERTGIVG